MKVFLFQKNSEFTQLDGRKNRTVKRLCVTNVTDVYTGKFRRDLHLTLMSSGLL